MLCQKQNYDVNTKARQFLIGDPVWIRNFRPGKRWLAGTITKRKGNIMYKVTLEGKAIVWNRHANQLRIRSAVTLPCQVLVTVLIVILHQPLSLRIVKNQLPQYCVDLQESANPEYPRALQLKGRRCSTRTWTRAHTHYNCTTHA